MKKLVATLAASLVGALVAVPAGAHHSFAMFESFELLVEDAVVVQWAFNNPHNWLYVNITSPETGEAELWGFEGAAPVAVMGRNPSVNGNTFQVGDALTFSMCPLRDGGNGGHLGWVQGADGTIYNPADGGCRGNNAAREDWVRWMEMGLKDSREGEAADEAAAPAAPAEGAPTGDAAPAAPAPATP